MWRGRLVKFLASAPHRWLPKADGLRRGAVQAATLAEGLFTPLCAFSVSRAFKITPARRGVAH